ncbi:MAG TPA: YciI family protein [Thermomicrobiales bacterium]|nr:YciI family protein [Thermomicrobiales bacterium]
MALYAATLTYTEDKDKIQEVRPTHREYLQKLVESGKLHESGPFTDDSGSLIVYRVESEAEARELLANDPFTTSGVITDATVKEWKIVMSSVGTAL